MRYLVGVRFVLAGLVLLNARFLFASEADDLRERAADMKREMVELLEKGRKDEALEIKRGIEKIVREAEKQESAMKKGGGPGGKEKQKFGEAGARIKHLRQAAEHLQAAGMQDIADQVRKHAMNAEEELKRASASGDKPQKKQDAGEGSELRDELRRMREQVEKLRFEVNELREQAKR